MTKVNSAMIRMLALVFVALLFVIACGGGGGDDPTPTPEQHVVTGSVTLSAGDSSKLGGDFRVQDFGDRCEGSGRYDDIHVGGTVTVRDGAGTVIATGGLDEGEYAPPQSGPGIRCVHTFDVDVPLADVYSFEVTQRGEISYSYDEMTDSGWTIEFSLE